MKTIILILFIVFSTFSSASFALELSYTLSLNELNSSSVLDETSCLAPELVDDILADFRLETDDENKDIRFKRCDPKNAMNIVIRSLAFLKYGNFNKGEKSTDQVYYAEFENDSAYDFIKRRIRKIKLTNCHSTSILAAASRNNPVIDVCIDIVEPKDKNKSGQSPFYLAETIVHEARHIDSNDTGHTVCNHGSYMGMNGGCDTSRSQKGGYHFGTDYLVKMAKYGTNFHPAIKALSRNSAFFLLTNQFNRVPKIDRTKLVFLKKKSGEMIGINEEGQILIKNNIGVSTVPFDRVDESLLLYKADKKQFFTWRPYSDMVPDIGLIASEISKLYSDTFSLVDIQFGGANGFLEGKSLHYLFYRPLVIKDNYLTGTVDLQFQPDRFLNSEFCHGDVNSLYILGKDKNVIQVSMDSAGKISTSEIPNCETQFRTVTSFRNSKIGLTVEGRLLINEDNSWKDMEPFNEERFTFLSSSVNLLNFFLQ